MDYVCAIGWTMCVPLDGEEGAMLLHTSKLTYPELRQHNITEKLKGWMYTTWRRCKNVIAVPARIIYPSFYFLCDVVLTQFGVCKLACM
eukprot:7617195-Pyramimonas_sp.AAC.1